MKVVASDLGRYEREAWVDNVTIAPAERYVVDVRFPTRGDVTLVNRVRAIDHIMARFFEEKHVLGVVHVGAAGGARPIIARTLRATSHEYLGVRRHRDATDSISPARSIASSPITLQPGDLPFPMRPLLSLESVYRNPVEWSGTMPEMDWIVTGQERPLAAPRRADAAREHGDRLAVPVGDVVKLRLVNDRAALHAMHHPIHIHGQRFLVLSVNGVPNDNLVWKDTVLLPTGFVADVLLEVTNPGKWMLHCHIAEHIETGMRMVFEVCNNDAETLLFVVAHFAMAARRTVRSQTLSKRCPAVRHRAGNVCRADQRPRRRRHRRAAARRADDRHQNGKIASVGPAAQAKVPGRRPDDRSRPGTP